MSAALRLFTAIGICVASMAAAYAQGPASVITGVSPRGSSVLLDLDGDSRADLATAEPEAASRNMRYRVEVRLTQDRATTFYVNDRRAPGLRMTGVDVDGDGDLDLVITSRFRELIGVWINDGHGRFTPGTPTAVVTSMWRPAPCDLEARGGVSHTPVFVCPSSGAIEPSRVVVGSEWHALPAGDLASPKAARLLNPGSSLRAPPTC